MKGPPQTRVNTWVVGLYRIAIGTGVSKKRERVFCLELTRGGGRCATYYFQLSRSRNNSKLANRREPERKS